MKKKIFLFASLAAFVLPLTVGCKKECKSHGNDHRRSSKDYRWFRRYG